MIKHIICCSLLCLASACKSPSAPLTARDCDGLLEPSNQQVSLPGEPFDVIATRDRCWIFVSIPRTSPQNTSGGIVILARRKGRIQFDHFVAVPGKPHKMSLSQDEKLLVLPASKQIHFFDTAALVAGKSNALSGSIVSQEENDPASFYSSISPDSRFLFISDELANRIRVFDLKKLQAEGFATGKPIAILPVGIKPIAVTLSRNGRYLFTTSHSADPKMNWPKICIPAGKPKERAPEGVVHVFNIDSLATAAEKAILPVATVPAGCSPVRLSLSPDGATAWVSARDDDALLAFETDKLVSDPGRARLVKVNAGKSPTSVGISENGRTLWVVNSRRRELANGGPDARAPSWLTVLNVPQKITRKGLQVRGKVDVGIFPREAFFLSDGQTLLVTNAFSHSLQVIDTERVEIKPEAH